MDFDALIERFEAAVSARAFKGAQPPEDQQAIEEEYVSARDALRGHGQALAAHVDEARQIATHWIENEQTTANVWELARKIGRWSLSAPETSLARVKAEAYEAGYVDGWDHRAGTKPEDGDYRACGRRLAKQLADGKYRGAGDIT